MEIYGKKFGKVIGMLLLTVIGALLTGTLYSADMKIGSIDIQKAVNECKTGREAKKEIITTR